MNFLTYFFISILFSIQTGFGMALSTPEEHVEFLKKALWTAKERIVIVSPYISCYALQKSEGADQKSILTHIREVRDIGTEVIIYTDAHFDEGKQNSEKGRKLLMEAGADLRVTPRIHTKNVIIDDLAITFGSFNWLSAVTDKSSQYCRYETSIFLKAAEANGGLQKTLLQLNQLPIENYKGFHNFYEESKSARKGENLNKEILAAVDLYTTYHKHPFFSPVTRDILISKAYKNRPDTLRSINLFNIFIGLFNGGESFEAISGEADVILRMHATDAWDFIIVARAFLKLQEGESEENSTLIFNLASNMASGVVDYIDTGDNVEGISKKLKKMGMTDLAKKVNGEAYDGL